MNETQYSTKVLFLRTNYGKPDSRCEKEIYSLGRKYTVELFGLNREKTFDGIRCSQIKINEKSFTFRHVGIHTPTGEGFKKIFFPLLRFWAKEWNFLRRNQRKYNYIHACDFDAALPLLFLPHKARIVYDIFDYYADSHKGPKVALSLIRKLENRMIGKSDAVILCSESRKEQIYPATSKKLTIIHNTPSNVILPSIPKYCTDLKPCICKIVYVGMLSQDRFLTEMAEVIANRRDTELHIGGFGCLSEYFSEASKNHSNIFYYGKMPYEDVLSLEQQCDIMTAIYDPCVPNHKYAAPNKFYEALMLKKPLIMMRNTGMDTYVEKYKFGEVINGGAETFKEGFSRALDNLIVKKEQWAEMGDRGYKLYQKQFSWDEMEKRLLNLYDDLQSNINKD